MEASYVPPQMPGLLIALLGVLALVLTTVGLVVWRRDRLVFAVPVGALAALALGLSGPGFGTPVEAVKLLFEAAAVGLMAYTLLRVAPARFGPVCALLAGMACAFLGPLTAMRASWRL